MADQTITISFDKGEKLENLRNEITKVINTSNSTLTGYEVLGVLDVVRQDMHRCIEAMDEEEDG